MNELILKIRRGLKKPPRYIVERIMHEIRGRAERYLAPRRASSTTSERLANREGYSSVSDWWASLAKRSHVGQSRMSAGELEGICPGDIDMLIAEAERALRREVDLLGSGSIELGTPTDWHKDYKTNIRWAPRYCRDIHYSELGRPSDVKFPWEVSRMQWLIPAAQAYVLTGEEKFAVGVMEAIDEWISANPYAMSVNWACTMDVAIRAMTWTWLFHALCKSTSWQESGFQHRFLRSLWLHGDFITRNLEKSDINGNHYTANAAGLVFIGLFFGGKNQAADWHELGWNILCDELPRQVFEDGVDFEASVPYHRLVQELFLLPALYRQKLGLEVHSDYRERMLAMARFTEAYSRPDGSVPLWGDADDARALPFRMRPINDHRYLVGLAGIAFDDPKLIASFSGPCSEIVWIFGASCGAELPKYHERSKRPCSMAFPDGGVYILRNEQDHIFIDCGPLGLAGRGGHGHNDLLSFEAVLNDVHLITDCGAYLYTADYVERNNFRSTAYHNTPCIDGKEINRFIRPDYLWFLENDAEFSVNICQMTTESDFLALEHTGYTKLPNQVRVHRQINLHHGHSSLSIQDSFEGNGDHHIEIPLHLAIGVTAIVDQEFIILEGSGRRFRLNWNDHADWDVEVGQGRVSPTYGVVHGITRLSWTRHGPLRPLKLTIEPI